MYASVNQNEQTGSPSSLKRLVDNVTEILYSVMFAKSAEMDFISKRAGVLTGYPVEEILSDGNGWIKIVHADDEAKYLECLERCRKTGEGFELEYRIVNSEGSVIEVSDRGEPVVNKIGEVIGAILPAFIIAPVMQLLSDAYGIGTPAREGVQALKAPQAVMFEKLVGGIFGSGKDIPWDLVGWGAAIGVAAILIDRFFLEPRKTKFRLHAMPLAVGMYLPWTVTFPILIGGLVYRVVDRRSVARGDSEQKRQSVIHRGLLFSSGLVAGEAIMGILIALLVMAKLDIPFINLAELGVPSLAIDLLSLFALSVIIVMLLRKALAKGDEPAEESVG